MKLAFTHPLHLVIGFIIWSLWFIGVYGGVSLACMASATPETLTATSWINIVLMIFTLLTVAVLLILAYKCWREPVPEGAKKQHHFTLRLSAALYLSAAISTLAVGLPILALPPCL